MPSAHLRVGEVLYLAVRAALKENLNVVQRLAVIEAKVRELEAAKK
ncbi:MAG: hypothetical protein PXY39_12670 [archaeon]|nr:hypothetical protein [archaeon]